MTKTLRPEPAWAAPFIEALARSGNARQAAREVGVGRTRPRHRRKTNQPFAEQWSEALARADAARYGPKPPEVPVTGPPVRNWREKFFAELANTSNVAASAALVRVPTARIYRLKREDPQFAACWLAALHEGYDLLEMEMLGYLRDRQPGWKMDVSGALRVLAAHRAAVERRRAMMDPEEEDEQAMLESLDRFLGEMRQRRFANEAILLEVRSDHGTE